MRRRIAIAIVLIIVMMQDLTICANDTEPVLVKKRATAYCLQGITCTGTEVRDGVVASGDKELIGKTIVMYQRLPNDQIGNILGIYQVEDSGCKAAVIDVWMPDLDACQEFMNLVYEDGCQGKIFIQVIEEVEG